MRLVDIRNVWPHIWVCEDPSLGRETTRETTSYKVVPPRPTLPVWGFRDHVHLPQSRPSTVEVLRVVNRNRFPGYPSLVLVPETRDPPAGRPPVPFGPRSPVCQSTTGDVIWSPSGTYSVLRGRPPSRSLPRPSSRGPDLISPSPVKDSRSVGPETCGSGLGKWERRGPLFGIVRPTRHTCGFCVPCSRNGPSVLCVPGPFPKHQSVNVLWGFLLS